MNIVCFGAHPDDAEVFAGGSILKWVRAGHRVLVVSLTNGDVGHHEEAGGALARRRRAESEAAAALGGYRVLLLDNHDGELAPTLALRKDIVRIIRREEADLVLTHRPWDYHPDHRYGAMAVQDAAYMVMVPHFCPDTPAVRHNPVFCYMMDQFTKPLPFSADVAVNVSDVMQDKYRLLDAMPSQFYEWLPWIERQPVPIPESAPDRLRWLQETWDPYFARACAAGEQAMVRRYGAAANGITHVELFEVCEYGSHPNTDALLEYFPL
ncbi:MAG: PIG-L family deacetylase [Candidatus Hydrogenedentes bacterium]|nr:PIG-L family deacetylase [Candidatus Hydrogenedentota bacterium]